MVVQGPVMPEITRRCLESIRAHLPGAEVILSTWEGVDVTGLDYDHLVLNQDPGPIETKALKAANLNRLLWSTQQGLRKVERPYCLKFRTDFVLTGSRLLATFGAFPDYLPGYRIFQERVVISSVVTWRTSRTPLGQYHPSDMFGLGRTEDIRQWWSAPLYPFAQRAEWESEPVLLPDEPGALPLDELSPEQYIWLSALNRSRKIRVRENPSRQELETDLLWLLNNFTVVEAARVDVQWIKPRELPFGHEAALFGMAEYRYLYRRKIEGRRFQFPPLSIFSKRLQLLIQKYSPDFLKPLWHFIKPKRLIIE